MSSTIRSDPRSPTAWWSEPDNEWVDGPRDAEGRLHGAVRYWDPAGRFLCECEHAHGQPHGRARRFHPDGSLAQDCTYVAGRLHGPRSFYRPAAPLDRASASVATYECEYEDGDLVATRFRDRAGAEVDAHGARVPPRPPGVPPTAGPMPGGEWLAMKRRGEEGTETLEMRIWGRDGQLREEKLADGRCRALHPGGALRSAGLRVHHGASRPEDGPWRYGDPTGTMRRDSLYALGVERSRSFTRPAAAAGPGGGVTRVGPVARLADNADALECGRWELRDERGAVLRVVDLGEPVDDATLLADPALDEALDLEALRQHAAAASDPGGAAARLARLRLFGRTGEGDGSQAGPAAWSGPGPAWTRVDRDGEATPLVRAGARLAELVHALAWGVPASEALGELAARMLRVDRPQVALDLVDAALRRTDAPGLHVARVVYLRALGRDDDAELELDRMQPDRVGAREEARLLGLREPPRAQARLSAGDEPPRAQARLSAGDEPSREGSPAAGRWRAYADAIADANPTQAAALRSAAAGEPALAAAVAAMRDALPEPLRDALRILRRDDVDVPMLWIDADEFLAHHDVLFRAAPLVEDLMLGEATDAVARLATLPAMRRYAALSFSDTLLFDGAAAQLARSPHLGGLRHLGLASTSLYDDDLRAILGSRAYPGLTSLDISNDREGQDYGFAAFQELVDAAFAGTLTALAMARRWFADDVVAVLAALPRLRALELEGGQLGDDGAIALAALERGWTRLDLRSNAIGEYGALALAGAASLAGLVELRLGHNPLGTDATCELLAAPQLARLRVLDLAGGLADGERPTAAFGRALIGAPLARSLEALSLSLGALGPEGARGLAAAPLQRLRRLNLYGNAVGDAGAVALADAPALAALRALDLGNNAIGDEGGLALARSPHLAGLAWLELGGATLSPATRAALVARFGTGVKFAYPWGR